jgi:hypothetical protein
MRYHDFHLSGYTVSDFGNKIVLHLVYDCPNRVKEESDIEFSDVACHHFVHTSSAIITEIEQESPAAFVKAEEALLSRLAKQHGLNYWDTSALDYAETLEKKGLRVWRIASAIGVAGFIVARGVRQLESPAKLTPSL